MANYRVSFDFSGIEGLAYMLQDSIAPALSAAVGKSASLIAADWQEKVLAAGGKGGLYAAERDAYANSIKVEFNPGDLHALVYTPYEQASQIDEGRPARDLKAMLDTSHKTKISKTGKRYLIIPFRHTLASMPKNEVRSLATTMNKSSIVSSQWSHVASSIDRSTSLISAKRTYNWGVTTIGEKSKGGKQYLQYGALPSGLVPKMKPSHKTDIYAGMRRMDTSSGKSKSSAYLTFRVMVEGSSGWIIQARTGLFIAKGVEQRGQATLNTEMHAIANAASMA